MSGTTPFDCPRCGVGLAMSERQGIEIDYCPQCRGVWLDRGELDKIIASFEAMPTQSEAQPTSGSPAGGWTLPTSPPPQAAPGTPAGGWTLPAPEQQQPWSGGQHGYSHDDDDGRRGYEQGGTRRKSWLKEIFG